MNESFIDALAPNQTLLYKRLILDLQIDESVAAFACLQSNFRNMESVCDYLFESFEHVSGKTIMQHPFIGYDPSVGQTGAADLESQRSQGLICFLC